MSIKDSLYLVDPSSRSTQLVAPTTFFDLKVKERQDLQAWIMNRPEVLGEPLLLVTSEFDRFDRSDRRLDLLLLDKNATLVVAELKLDAGRTLADQQAIRYAAFCSTMTMDDIVACHARTTGTTEEDAEAAICAFLETDDLPTLGGEPRIMLVAGGFQDQELTATVMWLRKFGIDISCIELTPYRYPGDETNVLLVPKTLIPLPEAREYQISVERKERTRIERTSATAPFFAALIEEFAQLEPPLKPPRIPTGDWISVSLGHPQIHYEWMVRKRPKMVDVAVHFESPDQEVNLRRLQCLIEVVPNLTDLAAHGSISGPWGKQWAQFAFRIPYSGQMPDREVARGAAAVMDRLIRATLEELRAMP
jgi:hypothetical protein